MSPRYLLLIGDRAPAAAARLQLTLSSEALVLAFSAARMAVLASAGCRCLPVGHAGCIVGSLFHRHGPAEPVAQLSTDEAASIVRTGGASLLGSHWGSYVAAVGGSDLVSVLRDPSGTLSCYFAASADLTMLASDADLLVSGGLGPVGLDYSEIGLQLYRAYVPSPATALLGVEELLAGFSLRLGRGSVSQEPCWSPWDHAVLSDDGREPSAEFLERAVAHCVQASASPYKRLLLSVSGGLDSSIIAACLADGKPETVCLTMFTHDPAGDERPFARELCRHLRLQLVERPYRLEDIDLGRPLAPHLPRPRDRTQALAYERVHLAVAAEIGADAFVTGNGGDSVFGYSQSAAPIADRYLTDGFGPEWFSALLDVCRQTGCNVIDAARHAWRLVRSPPDYRVRPDPLFLDRNFVAGIGEGELRHAWLQAPRGALPGKAAHIASILRVQPNLEADRGYHLPLLSPLMSQPVIEACLKVPSWEWRAGGQDRSLARQAFGRKLPRIVLDRRVKGTPSRFAARLLDHFRQPIRERLLDGQLAAHRIIDRALVERALAGERPVPDLDRVRILELVNAEAWIAHWKARGSGPNASRVGQG